MLLTDLQRKGTEGKWKEDTEVGLKEKKAWNPTLGCGTLGLILDPQQLPREGVS